FQCRVEQRGGNALSAVGPLDEEADDGPDISLGIVLPGSEPAQAFARRNGAPRDRFAVQIGENADWRTRLDKGLHRLFPLRVGGGLAVRHVAPGHAPAIFRAAGVLEQRLEIGPALLCHGREAKIRQGLSPFPYLSRRASSEDVSQRRPPIAWTSL